MITDRIGRHEVLLPINHKNYNFREGKNSQVMKERKNLHKILTKGDVNILWPPRLPLIIRDGKNLKASARGRTLTHVITTFNVIG